MSEEMFNELKRFIFDTLELKIHCPPFKHPYVSLECDGAEVSRISLEHYH